METMYRFEGLKEKLVLREQNRVLMEEHEAVRNQLHRLSFYDPTESHAEIIEDLINVSELLALEFKRLRQEVLTLKLEKLHDQQTARTYPFQGCGDDITFGTTSEFDPSAGGR